MPDINDLIKKNQQWAKKCVAEDGEFFSRLTNQQTPKYLWIGCSDSRVPANEIVGLAPGEIFVHRNVANVVVHTDLNCLSVVQYAVEVLKVEHIIVCGHYGCGGVAAALEGKSHGLIDNWLRHIKDVYHENRKTLNQIEDLTARRNKLCELNVEAQVANVCYTTIVQDAWSRGQQLSVHGWIYSLQNGLINDLEHCIDSLDDLPKAYQMD